LDRGGRRRAGDTRRRVLRRAGALSLQTRIAVVGGPGSGKTTVAAALARQLDVPHIELDALWWQPGWRAAGAEVLRARLEERLSDATTGWVIDGNYLEEVARTTVLPATDVLLWLDLPRPVAVRRAVARTARRVVGRRPLWNDNREAARNLAPANLVRVWRAWPGYSARIAVLLDELGDAAPDVVRLRSDAEVRSYVTSHREVTGEEG